MNTVVNHVSWLARKHQTLLAHMSGESMSAMRLCFSVLTLAAAIDADCAARLARHGLSEGRFLVLFLLHENPNGMAPHTLAAQCGVTRATITGLLNGLEKDGWIERLLQTSDRRRVIARLSQRGRTRTAKVLSEHLHWMAGLFVGVQPAQQQQLERGLYALWQRTDAGRNASAAAVGRHLTKAQKDSDEYGLQID